MGRKYHTPTAEVAANGDPFVLPVPQLGPQAYTTNTCSGCVAFLVPTSKQLVFYSIPIYDFRVPSKHDRSLVKNEFLSPVQWHVGNTKCSVPDSL